MSNTFPIAAAEELAAPTPRTPRKEREGGAQPRPRGTVVVVVRGVVVVIGIIRTHTSVCSGCVMPRTRTRTRVVRRASL
jgi:hypothetical protein